MIAKFFYEFVVYLCHLSVNICSKRAKAVGISIFYYSAECRRCTRSRLWFVVCLQRKLLGFMSWLHSKQIIYAMRCRQKARPTAIRLRVVRVSDIPRTKFKITKINKNVWFLSSLIWRKDHHWPGVEFTDGCTNVDFGLPSTLKYQPRDRPSGYAKSRHKTFRASHYSVDKRGNDTM